MGAEYSSKGLTRIILPRESKEDIILKVDTKNSVIQNNEQASHGDLLHRLQSYLAGEPVDFTEKLDLDRATVFQRRVWGVTQAIPYGQTRSYTWVADQINCNSARAIGQALSKNPVPIVVPCHRVIKSDGSLGGFSDGLKLKELLIGLEITP
jgi:O-6-methylguanine DNA methyltransferase